MSASDSVLEFLREAGRKGGLAGKGKLATKKKASKAAKARWRKARLAKAIAKLSSGQIQVQQLSGQLLDQQTNS